MATEGATDVVMEDLAPPEDTGSNDVTLETPKLSFAVLHYVNDIRYKHGIRSEEYGRFHAYCSKRLGILRRQLRCVAIRSNKYLAEEFPEVINDTRYLEILALRVERCWSYGMLLKSQYETSHASKPSARHHYVKRFEKARKLSSYMEHLCQQFAETNTANNAKVYRSLMEGIVHFEHKRYQEAFNCLSAYANVMDQRKRMYQDDPAVSDAYASQMAQVNAIIKLCSFHMRVAGTMCSTRMVVRDEDQNADMITVMQDPEGNLAVYCRGSPLEVKSQFLLQQLLDAMNSTEKLLISDETLLALFEQFDFGEGIRKFLVDIIPQDQLMVSYEEVMSRISECSDTIHSEMLSSIYDQEPLRRLEDMIILVKTILEMEKCAIMEIMSLYSLYHAKVGTDGGVALPDSGDAVRYAQIMKQQLGTVMKDSQLASVFATPLETTKTVNGMLLGMQKLAHGESNEGMALINWAYMRQQEMVDLPDRRLNRLIWRSLMCFAIMQKAGHLCSMRYYKRSVAIFARSKFQPDTEDQSKLNSCKLFGLEKRLLPCKPIIFDLAYMHNEAPDLSQKSSIMGGVKSMFASFWKSK